MVRRTRTVLSVAVVNVVVVGGLSGVDTGSLKIRVGVDVGFPVEFVETGDLGARARPSARP